MSTALPHGLINIARTEVPGTASTNAADVRLERAELLHQFWKVHDVRFKVARHQSDYRSRNLFWRTWSHQSLRDTISATRLTTLWNQCRQNICLSTFELQFKPNVPQGQHLFNRPIPKSKDFSTFVSGTTTSVCSNDSSDVQQPSGQWNNTEAEQVVSTLDSITGSVQAHATTRPKTQRNSSSRYLSARAMPSGTKPRRPPLGKRKSSQAAPTPSAGSNPPGVETNSSRKLDLSSRAPQSETPSSAFELPSPSSSWEDESDAEQTREQSELVIDKDFRNKFAEKIASSSSLTAMGRSKKTGSVVRFAQAIPEDEGKGKSNEGDPLSDVAVPRAQRPSLPHRHSASSVAISDSENEDERIPGLARTRSQLSFLISERRSTGGPAATASERPHLPRTLTRKEEEARDVLAMAHGQGVTKAGGNQVPAQHRLNQDVSSRYSSPEPDATF